VMMKHLLSATLSEGRKLGQSMSDSLKDWVWNLLPVLMKIVNQPEYI
jgi:hypothetical protein